MKTEAVVPARLAFTAAGLPFAADYGDIYHPQAGAIVQARHVFLAGNQLPQRWQDRADFTILETGFGLGNNFLATWQAWRADPQRPARLHFVSVEQHPLTRANMAGLVREPELQPLADALAAAWPPLTPNLHRLAFEEGRIELLLALGDVQAWLPELLLRADAFFLDGFAPARNPSMWDLRVCKALGRLAAPGATLATWSAASALRGDLTTAGFEVRLAAGTGGKRDITLARHLPRGGPRPATTAAAAATAAGGERRALIVGAGLAGCAAAWGLADCGWHSSLYERRPTIAGEASGNPAGLFHGTLHRQDGTHARLMRAAALDIRPTVATAIAEHGVAGATDGLLRLEAELPLAEMQALLKRLGLPLDYVRACSADEAAALYGWSPGLSAGLASDPSCGLSPCLPTDPSSGPSSGLSSGLPAWFYSAGGWVDPAGLARSFVERARGRVSLRTGLGIEALRRRGANWQLLDSAGEVIDEAAVVVLANAGDARRLLGEAGWAALGIDWRPTRGQVSWLPDTGAPAALAACRLPVAGAGYLSPAPGGRLMFGATSQVGDNDPAVRVADHLANLARLAQLTGSPLTGLAPASLAGRTAWRWSTADRLPIIGAVPELSPTAAGRLRGAAGRPIDREPGLFLFTALGSRGILWSSLGARILAAGISGGRPLPVEASLARAVDPARFQSRALRRRGHDPAE